MINVLKLFLRVYRGHTVTDFYHYPIRCKVGRSKPPLVLTSGFNRLKLPRSICQKVVNTNLSSRLKILRGCFRGRFRYKVRIYGLFIEKRKKKYCFIPAKGTFHLSTDFCITVQEPNTLYSF